MKSEKINKKSSHEYDFSPTHIDNFYTPAKLDQHKTNTQLKILIIDEHRLFADGILNLLNNYDENIRTKYAVNILAAHDVINNVDAPDLILLSINNTVTENSYALIDQLKIKIPIMILSATDSLSAAGLAIEHNASGFISKNCSRENILEAILSVLDGNIYISKPKQTTGDANQNTGRDKITKRQHQVLCLLSEGLLNKQIAWELKISENTVKAHLSDLFKHLHVTNRTAAVKYGYENGLIV